MIVVCTAHDANYAEMASITFPTVERYCVKHNYGLVYDSNVEPELADACKIALFHKLYAGGQFSGHDLFMWIDTDALIMNSRRGLHEVLKDIIPLHFEEGVMRAPIVVDTHDGRPNYHIWYGTDFNYINTGVWFARFTSHADHFLRVSQQLSFAMGWADWNGIFQTYLQPVFQPWVKIVPGKPFNAMPYALYGIDDWPHKNEINNYEPGDFVLHLAGIDQQARMELLREYAKQAV